MDIEVKHFIEWTLKLKFKNHVDVPSVFTLHNSALFA